VELLGATPRPRVPRERDRLHFTLQGSRGVTVHGAADELLYTDENGCVCAKDQVFKCDIYIRENHGYASVPDWSEGARCGIVTTVHSLRCACGRRGTVRLCPVCVDGGRVPQQLLPPFSVLALRQRGESSSF